MPKGRYWDEQDLWRVCDMWADGKAGGAIGKEFGVSRAAILSQVRKLGYNEANRKERFNAGKNFVRTDHA